jgi:hypothetical protein
MFRRTGFFTAAVLLIGMVTSVGASGITSGGVTGIKIPQPNNPASPLEINIIQLDKLDGVIPVEIHSPDIRLTSVSDVNGVSFIVRNNSEKEVRAFCLAYTFRVVQNAQVARASFYQTAETFLHPDMARSSDLLKPIETGAEKVITDPSRVSFGADSIVIGVDIWLDYVEFEDGSKLGINHNGETMITGRRKGADRYASWLRDQYRTRPVTGALKSIIQLKDLPVGFESSSSYEKQGALMYRNHLRRIAEKEGDAGLAEFVSRSMDEALTHRR